MSLTPVTVLMPVYNAGKFIRSAIRSILEQTHNNFEFLIIDDGSTDDTASIISTFSDSRIRYKAISHGGLGKALNYGLQIAAHSIIARMDADDISFPERLEKQIAVFTRLPENAVLSCRYLFFTGQRLWGYIHSPLTHESIVKRLPLHNEITHAGVMYNKSFILKNGGYISDTYEDFELWLRIRNQAHFQIMPEPLVLIQYRKRSLSRDDMASQYNKVYALTRPLFCDDASLRLFNIKETDILLLRGWREYFFGSPFEARRHWRKAFYQILSQPALFMAYLITFLPGPLFVSFKENRFRFRLDYFRILRREDRTRYKKLLRHFLN